MAFRTGLLDAKNILSLRRVYETNQPFPHLVVQDAMQDNFLRRTRDEIDSSLSFNLDDSHVYRLRRSTHLANISNPDEYAPDILPNLTHLRDALNSLEFREWLSSITGVGPLSGTRSSMAINVYTPGDHLLVHDDCNPKSRNRRVSFILYLTDPDNAWKLEWGGGLRLYACESSSTSTAGVVAKTARPTWSECVQPCFNRLVFFGLRPGETFHEVEEVLQSGDMAADQDRRRMAISGWFHAAQEGDEGFNETFYLADVQRMEHLYRLKAAACELYEPQIVFAPFEDEQLERQDADFTLTRQDVAYLSQHLAPKLLAQDEIEHASRRFRETCTLQLQPFLCEQLEARIKDYLTNHEDTHATVNGPDSMLWKSASPPDKQRFLYLESFAASPARQNPISQLLNGPLRSRAFGKWLALVTGLEIPNLTGHHVMARRFRRGLDYILADPQSQNGPQLDYTLLITPTSCHQTVSVNDVGRDGGEEIYRAAEKDGVELAFAGTDHCRTGYRGSGYTNTPSWNVFSVIFRRDRMQSIVNYVSRAASRDRLDIKGKVRLKNDDLRY